MFPLCRGYGLLVRVFPFNVLETTVIDEEPCGHENPNDEEPLAVWIIQMIRQEWRAAMCPLSDELLRDLVVLHDNCRD